MNRRRMKPNQKQNSKICLPTIKNTPVTDMGKYTWMFYGKPKIGKTSFAAQFDSNLLIALEPGYKSLSVYAVDVPSDNGWNILTQIKEELISGDTNFNTVTFDVGNIAYDLCLEHVCSDMGVTHPSDVSWGKAWKALSDNFKKLHLDLAANKFGLIVLAHEKIRETKSDEGIKIDQICPTFSSGAEDFYAGFIDTIGYYQYVGSTRYLLIRGNEEIIAGTRLSKNFNTPDGEPIYRIPMGNSEEEAYENLVTAFNNEQTETFKNIDKEESEEKKLKPILRKRNLKRRK